MSTPVAPKALRPFIDRLRNRTRAPGASILNTNGVLESPANAAAQSMVIDLLMSTEPKSLLSTQLISPPALVLLKAVCNDEQGWARLQSWVLSPLLATHVRLS